MTAKRILALSGGVGGAKLCQGLAQVLPAGKLQVLVNTADDFQHHGLHISPDIDTLLYTLAGLNDTKRGWGLAGESWAVLNALKTLDAETWFQLGDKDLATHLWRSGQLASGATLSELTATLASRLGIAAGIHPMCDNPVRTIVHSPQGDLPFQYYFVKYACKPVVTGFSFEGIEQSSLNREVSDLLAGDGLSAIVLCPSNPFVSLAPILQVANCWHRLRDANVPVLAVSPIIGGQAIKGPAAKMMAELGLPVSAVGVAKHYQQHYPKLVDQWVVDTKDGNLAADIEQLGITTTTTNTVMKNADDRKRLAQFVLDRV